MAAGRESSSPTRLVEPPELGLLALATWALLAPVLRGLRLPRSGFVLLATALGTPFLFYATLQPGKNHTLDAGLFTTVVYLTYRYFRHDEPERRLPILLGAVLGLSFTVRYLSGAEAVGLVACLICFRRFRTRPRSQSPRRRSRCCCSRFRSCSAPASPSRPIPLAGSTTCTA